MPVPFFRNQVTIFLRQSGYSFFSAAGPCWFGLRHSYCNTPAGDRSEGHFNDCSHEALGTAKVLLHTPEPVIIDLIDFCLLKTRYFEEVSTSDNLGIQRGAGGKDLHGAGEPPFHSNQVTNFICQCCQYWAESNQVTNLIGLLFVGCYFFSRAAFLVDYELLFRNRGLRRQNKIINPISMLCWTSKLNF